MTLHIFRANPRLMLVAFAWAVGIMLLKILADMADVQWLELSPLLGGAIAAEVFILGFLLSGTASDFKEAEKLPGEVSASLETIADECLIIHEELALPEARECLTQLANLSYSIRTWLLTDTGLYDVMTDIRALNGPYRVFAPAIQAGFTTRLKGEQSTIRRLVLRMDTMRRTSYVAAGYLMAEIVGVLLVVVMLISDLGPIGPTVSLVGLISYLLIYLVGLIRDLDNPFEYRNSEPGAADADLSVLERSEERLRALAAGLDPAPEDDSVESPV
jgi:predicted membrane chloride channel (bestrophin family)